MGREAVVHVEVGAEAGEAKVLLESAELILRGGVRRKFPREAMQAIVVDGDVLTFSCGGEAVRLHLGAATSAWAKALTTPPASLRTKLGLDGGVLAFVVGVVDDEALNEALAGAATTNVTQASMIVAVVERAEDLAAAVALSSTLPLWAVYPKGKAARFGDNDIRTALREAGYRDTKTCAVSARLTATRYNPGKN